MADEPKKEFPAATSELSEIFGFNKEKNTHGDSHFHEVSSEDKTAHVGATAPPPAALSEVHAVPDHAHEEPAKTADSHEVVIEHDIAAATNAGSGVGGVVKKALPYVFVFGVGVLLYIFFFQSLDFSKLFNSAPKPATPKETALESIMSENMGSYSTWMAGYYYDVSDASVLDPGKDNSGNGLSNFQKFLLNLNPKSYDTLGLGMADSEALAQGINPLTGGLLTNDQKTIIDRYFDLEIIMNRLTLAHLGQNGQVAGATTTIDPQLEQRVSNTLANQSSGFESPRGNNGGFSSGTGYQQSIYNNPFQSFVPTSAPAAGVVLDGATLDINTSIPGRLEIPSLKINVPIVFSTDPKSFDKDLQVGVVHYPGTALPGQIGTAYISGHSSNYVWAKGDFNKIFSKLGDLADNTSFKVTVVQKNGKDAILHYVVKRRQEYKPTDQAQFENTGVSTVALSTCWPIGTTQKRLVVFGELTQVEK